MALTHRGPLLLAHTISALTRTLLDLHLEGTGVGPGEFALYSVVRLEQPVTPSRLADILGMPATTLSYAIRQAEQRGHLRRSRNPDDGRSVLITLTATGSRLTNRAVARFGNAIAAFRAQATVEEEALLVHLEAMAGALERAIAMSAQSAAAG